MVEESNDRHRIRLRGPWWRSIGRSFDPRHATRVDWAAALATPPTRVSTQQRVDAFVLRRTFNSPTGLEDGDRLFLVLRQVDYVRSITLNGQGIWTGDETASPHLEIEVSQYLQDHNELELLIAVPCPAPPRSHGEVALEIG
ncbi:hypothetical protein [Roseimaritima sediminicola]|uniref:hypothetical protein n=1 Tax=Roseimaritima sediminicola TaxID=2662066 RepID=UPI00129855D1|nr:hypothetical protein [Roseimaritima sediminicola]